MNTIRNVFKNEVEKLLPVLHNTYRLIGTFQKTKTAKNKEKALLQLNITGKKLYFFKEYIQINKQPYFDAILNQDLEISDKIIAFDVAVGILHIEFSTPRAYMHKESKKLKQVLEQSRYIKTDKLYKHKAANDIIVTGINASPGIATGKAFIIKKNSDYRKMPSKSILIAKMTRPDIIIGFDKISGIVTDIGGSLCHAAIISREMNIPCITGTNNATSLIKNKMLILIDGNKGVVKKIK